METNRPIYCEPNISELMFTALSAQVLTCDLNGEPVPEVQYERQEPLRPQRRRHRAALFLFRLRGANRMSKWEDWLVNGGDMPELDIPEVKEVELE